MACDLVTTKRRGICPVCDRAYALTGADRIRFHKDRLGLEPRCPGSDGKPKGEDEFDDVIEKIREGGDLSKRSYGVLLSPTQALALNYVPAELVDAAEERGYRRAVQALRTKDAEEAEAFDTGTKEHPEYWDGWPYAHPYLKAADHLESLAAAAPRNEGAQT